MTWLQDSSSGSSAAPPQKTAKTAVKFFSFGRPQLEPATTVRHPVGQLTTAAISFSAGEQLTALSMHEKAKHELVSKVKRRLGSHAPS